MGAQFKILPLPETRQALNPEPPAVVMDGLDGFLRETVDFIVRTARSPQPFLALGSAIAAVGAGAGRRYRTHTNLRTNAMILGLAGSGSGKERPREFLSELFSEAGLVRYLGGSKIGSSAGLTRAVQDHPVRLFPLDEIGHMLGVNGSRNAGTHKMEIGPLLTEMYSKAGGTYDGANFGDSKAYPQVRIINPHIVFFGVTVPGPLWKALGSGALSDGSLARFLTFQTPNDDPDPNKRLVTEEIPESLCERLRMMAGVQGVPGNLAHLPMPSSEKVADIRTVLGDDAAATLIDQVDDEETTLKRQNRHNESVVAFWARYGEHVKRLSMIKAISRDPFEPVIGSADVRWAIALAKHCIQHVIAKAEDHVADSSFQEASNLIKCFVRDNGPSTTTQIARAIRKIDSKTRDSTLGDLVKADILRLTKIENGGPKATAIYSYAG
jgi:hypothetical protein